MSEFVDACHRNEKKKRDRESGVATRVPICMAASSFSAFGMHAAVAVVSILASGDSTRVYRDCLFGTSTPFFFFFLRVIVTACSIDYRIFRFFFSSFPLHP